MFENIIVSPKDGTISSFTASDYEALQDAVQVIRDYTNERVKKDAKLNPNRIEVGMTVQDTRSGLVWTVKSIAAGNFAPLSLEHKGACNCAVRVNEDDCAVLDARDLVPIAGAKEPVMLPEPEADGKPENEDAHDSTHEERVAMADALVDYINTPKEDLGDERLLQIVESVLDERVESGELTQAKAEQIKKKASSLLDS